MRTADVLGAASNFREYDFSGEFLPILPNLCVSLASSLIMIITTAGFYMTISEV